MAMPHMTPPRPDSPVPPASSGDVVVPIRPKPPAFPAVSAPARPVIIEADVVDYLVKAPLEQRWRILQRVAMATWGDEPAPASAAPPPPNVAAPPPVVATPPPPVAERQSATPPPVSTHPVVLVQAPAPQPVAETPPPASQRPQLELVDQTLEQTRPPPAAPVATPPPPPPASVAPPPASVAPPPQRLAYSAPPPPPEQIDHAEVLFEAMHDLTMLDSAPKGARFCLQVALAAVPCLAGLVHLRDPKSLELVVVHAEGPRADALLGTRTLPIDPLAVRASRAGKPVVATYGAEPDAETTKCPRHAHFDPWSVVVVPVMRGGQLLGLLEMVDPIDGNPHDEKAQAALAYVADRLARFLAEHPAEPISP